MNYCVYYIKHNIFNFRLASGMVGSIPMADTTETDILNYLKSTFKLRNEDFEKI